MISLPKASWPGTMQTSVKVDKSSSTLTSQLIKIKNDLNSGKIIHTRRVQRLQLFPALT
jgi:hypothetical protein